MKNKKLIAIITVCIVAVISCSIVAGAFFTANDSSVNEFTVADPKVTVEETPKDGPYEWSADGKHVSLRNDSTNLNGYVRAMIFPILKNADGNTQNIGTSGFSNPSGNTVTFGDFVFTLASDWSKNWVYKNGYFYYKSELAPGQSTSLLLRGVTLKGTADKTKYADITVNIEVSADIIQKEALIKDNAWSDVKITNGQLALR